MPSKEAEERCPRNLTREDFLFSSDAEDKILGKLGQEDRPRPEPSWFSRQLGLYHTARMVCVAIIILGMMIIAALVYAGHLFAATICSWVVYTLVRWLGVLAHSMFKSTIAYAIEQAHHSEEGWLMCRWLWISYRLIRDHFTPAVPFLNPFIPIGWDDSVDFILEKCWRAAEYARHQAGREVTSKRRTADGELEDVTEREWSFTADSRYNDLVMQVETRLDTHQMKGGVEVPGLRQRLGWWLDLAAERYGSLTYLLLLLSIANYFFTAAMNRPH